MLFILIEQKTLSSATIPIQKFEIYLFFQVISEAALKFLLFHLVGIQADHVSVL